MIDCYIYGAGNMYNRLRCIIKQITEINIIGVITSEATNYELIDGYKRYDLRNVDFGEADYVIIAVEFWPEIANVLKEHNVEEEKILLWRAFFNPDFDIQDYLKLKKSNPTIISNTCLAGRIYKELGLKMLTPTINAGCLSDRDYLQFMKNLKNYAKGEMKPLREKEVYYNPNTYNREFFMASGVLCEECKWLFPHDDIQVAIDNWNRRKCRINYRNISYLMIISSDEGAREFDKFDVERKIGFYYKDLGLKNVIYTPDWNNPEIRRKYDYNYVIYVHRYATNAESISRINWVKFLGNRDDYLRW